MLVGVLVALIGRINLLLIIEFGVALACVGFAIPNLYVFYLTQFMSGMLAASNVTVSVLVLTELFPAIVSSRMGTLIYLSLTGMILLSFTINFIFTDDQQIEDNYILIFGWIIIIAVTRFILIAVFFCGKDTPVNLVKTSPDIDKKESGSRKKLEWVLSSIYQKEEVPAIVNDLIRQKKEAEEEGPQVSFWNLFSKKYRLAFWVACTLNFMQQLSGVNFLIFYSKTFFDDING